VVAQRLALALGDAAVSQVMSAVRRHTRAVATRAGHIVAARNSRIVQAGHRRPDDAATVLRSAMAEQDAAKPRARRDETAVFSEPEQETILRVDDAP
jgi:hypothetical protein